MSLSAPGSADRSSSALERRRKISSGWLDIAALVRTEAAHHPNFSWGGSSEFCINTASLGDLFRPRRGNGPMEQLEAGCCPRTSLDVDNISVASLLADHVVPYPIDLEKAHSESRRPGSGRRPAELGLPFHHPQRHLGRRRLGQRAAARARCLWPLGCGPERLRARGELQCAA